MKSRVHLLVAYDIEDDRTRRRLAKGLEARLVRVQKSVFEGEVSRSAVQGVHRTIQRWHDPHVDSVRVYELCSACARSLRLYGVGPVHVRIADIVV